MASSSATTHAAARILGPFLLIFGAALALRAPALAPTVGALVQDDALVLFIGIVTLAIGFIMVGLHNYWNSPTAIVISLFGWLTAIRGAALLLVPHALTEVISRAMNPQLGMIAGGVFALIGLWLGFVGWFTKSA
jgi:hypothetical protein